MADPAGVKEAQRLFQLAVTKCPNTVITGGGYSQGAAIMHRAIEKLDEDVKSRISAILLYGDTQYPSDGPKIKGFPQEKVKTICKSDDGVCVGYITVTSGHLSYSGKAAEGANWVVEKVKASKRAAARLTEQTEKGSTVESPEQVSRLEQKGENSIE
jgi:cutinase